MKKQYLTTTSKKYLAKKLEKEFNCWDFEYNNSDDEFWISNKVAKWIDDNTEFDSKDKEFYHYQ